MAAFTTSLLVGLAIGSTALSASSQIKSGNAAKRAGEAERDAANSQADLADYNASVADIQAQDALERGADEESRFRSGVRAMIGAQRTQFAASGVDVGFGTAVDVQGDTAYQGELDALQIRTNAGREAWGYKVEATDYRNRAKVARKTGVYAAAAGREAQKASRYAAAGTIAGGATSLLDTYYGPGGRASRTRTA
jgi:hypothetical protein